jgi:hypothetical protein
MKELNVLIDMAERMIKEVNNSKSSKERTIYLTSLNQILNQIKEINVRSNNTDTPSQ